MKLKAEVEAEDEAEDEECRFGRPFSALSCKEAVND